MNRLSSKAYRNASRGQPCTLRMPGCTGGGEDTVFAHIRDSHHGRSIKASDISGCDACWHCHEVFDGRAKYNQALIDPAVWLFYALRGLQETLEARIAAGVIGWPADEERPPRAKINTSAERVKKSPKSEHVSRAIPSRPMGKGRGFGK